MYSISLDVIRGIINIRMRGVLTDGQRAELTDALKQALDTTPPSHPKEWLLRVTAKPLAQYTPELAVAVCHLIENSNSHRKSQLPPASRVVNCRPASSSAAARLVHFVTA